MIDGLKPYPTYKNSGLRWIGEIPSHWDLQRARWLFRRMDRSVRDFDEVVTCFRDGTVTLRKNRRLRGFTESLKEIGYQGIRRGDLVIHAMDAFAGAVGVSDSDGKGTPVYSVCEPASSANAHYYARLVGEMARSQWILALATGIRERSTDFRFEGFASQMVPLPPLAEQNAIVRFLNHADRRIRRYIGVKRKMIGLLHEQRRRIIHRTVTCGLDSSVPLAPSGAHWLGDLPDHWKAVQLRRIVSFVTSGSRGWARFYSDSGDIFLQSGNLGRSMALNLSFVQHVQPPNGSEGERTRVKCNDVLICITGALTGNVALVEDELTAPAFVNQHVALIRPDPASVFPRYLAYALHSELGRVQFKVGEYGGTKQGLGLDDVKSALVALPPLSEQRAICAELDRGLRSLATAIEGAEREMSLFREYQTGLIAHVATGKLDVREAAARLPDESESDPIDDVVTDVNAEDDVEELVEGAQG